MVCHRRPLAPRQRTGETGATIWFTAHSCSSEFFISAPLASAHPRLYICRLDSLCRLCPRSPVALDGEGFGAGPLLPVAADSKRLGLWQRGVGPRVERNGQANKRISV